VQQLCRRARQAEKGNVHTHTHTRARTHTHAHLSKWEWAALANADGQSHDDSSTQTISHHLHAIWPVSISESWRLASELDSDAANDALLGAELDRLLPTPGQSLSLLDCDGDILLDGVCNDNFGSDLLPEHSDNPRSGCGSKNGSGSFNFNGGAGGGLSAWLHGGEGGEALAQQPAHSEPACSSITTGPSPTQQARFGNFISFFFFF